MAEYKTTPTKLQPCQQHPIFSITEILEQVLLNLDATDVLCKASLVCSKWKDCATTSLDLKKKCFLVVDRVLEPDDDSLFLDIDGGHDFDPEVHNKLFHHFDTNRARYGYDWLPRNKFSFQSLRKELASENWTYTQYQRVMSLVVRTILADQDANIYQPYRFGICKLWKNSRERPEILKYRIFDLLNRECLNPGLRHSEEFQVWTGYGNTVVFHAAHMRSEYIRITGFLNSLDTAAAAGWRKTLLVQPACTTLAIKFNRDVLSEGAVKFYNPNGITVRDFWSTLGEVFEKGVDWEKRLRWAHDSSMSDKDKRDVINACKTFSAV